MGKSPDLSTRLDKDSMYPARLRMLKGWAGGRWEDGPSSSIETHPTLGLSQFEPYRPSRVKPRLERWTGDRKRENSDEEI